VTKALEIFLNAGGGVVRSLPIVVQNVKPKLTELPPLAEILHQNPRTDNLIL
jgi:hypothetical protein